MLELAVPERRPLSGRSQRLPVPVSGRLFWESVPGEIRHGHSRPVCLGLIPATPAPPLPSLPGLLHRWLHCKTFLLHPLKWLLFHSHLIFFKRECFVEAAPGYSGIHSSMLKPRLRGRLSCLSLAPPPPPLRPLPSPLSPSACAVSWHSRQGGCCGFLLYLM